MAVLYVAAWIFMTAWNYYVGHTLYDRWVRGTDPSSVFLGLDEKGREVHLREQFRTLHTQVIGTTSAGKSESIVLPLAIHDIARGNGMLIVDGKGDHGFLAKLFAYVVNHGRENDFRLFSLADLEASSAFNPLAFGNVGEVAERVFSSFTFENEYYRHLQYKLFALLIQLVRDANQVPTMVLVRRLLGDVATLRAWIATVPDSVVVHDLNAYANLSDKDRAERSGGLDAHLSHFTTGELAPLFNATTGGISFGDALANNQILYFQLPTMLYPVLAEATGRLALQCFQSAVARRHLARPQEIPSCTARIPRFFSCILDDFQDFIYPGFAAILNKSRSAGVGVVFSHQALGDLDKVDAAFRNIVSVNTNVKIVMRTSDPDTCDHFARSFGTKAAEKVTERRTRDFTGEKRTGDGSVRDVEEFLYHPNDIKGLRLGQGIVSIPHPKGVMTLKVAFEKRPDLPEVPLPAVAKASIDFRLLAPPRQTHGPVAAIKHVI